MNEADNDTGGVVDEATVTGDVVDIAAAICLRILGPAASTIRREGGDDELQKFFLSLTVLTLSMARDGLGIPAEAMADEALQHLRRAAAGS